MSSSLATWPDYLTYFNLFAGGSGNAYRHLVDSSLDWGQDLPGLKSWLDEQHAGRSDRAGPEVYQSYLGTGLPEFYGIKVRVLPSYFSW